MYPITQYNREGGADDRNHLTISTGYVFILMKYIVYIYHNNDNNNKNNDNNNNHAICSKSPLRPKKWLSSKLAPKKLGELGTSVKIILPKKKH